MTVNANERLEQLEKMQRKSRKIFPNLLGLVLYVEEDGAHRCPFDREGFHATCDVDDIQVCRELQCGPLFKLKEGR